MTPNAPRDAAPPEGARAAAPSFADVYEQHFDYVHRLVVRLALSSGSDHEDLVQEVFAVVHARLHAFEGRALLTTWLFQIAYRVVGAHIRKERVRRFALRAFALERHDDHQPPSAPGRIDGGRRARALAQALDALPMKKRSALVLFEIEGWSCAEIAEKMGIPVDTVYTRLHHARAELARRVARALKEETR